MGSVGIQVMPSRSPCYSIWIKEGRLEEYCPRPFVDHGACATLNPSKRDRARPIRNQQGVSV